MITVKAVKKKYGRTSRPTIYCRTKDLQKCPQKKAVCLQVLKMSPKKPNSAKRSIAKIMLLSTRRKTTAFIPGIGHNLQKFSTIFVRGGRTKDLPGLKYKAIRGKLDLQGVLGRMRARSKYGVKSA